MCEGVLGHRCPVRLEERGERNLWNRHSRGEEYHISTKETSMKVIAGQKKGIKSYLHKSIINVHPKWEELTTESVF